jgi:hypothetical protein
MRRFRSAITGRFVRKAAARRHPKTSVEETVVSGAEVRLYGNMADRTWRVGDEPAPVLELDADGPWMLVGRVTLEQSRSTV